MAYDNEVKNLFVILSAEGKSQRTIAKELNITLTTVQEWTKDLKADIEILKQQNKDKLLNTYTTIKQAHLTNLAQAVTRIDTELNKRDFTDVSTKDLLELKLKYQKTLISEYEKEPQIFELQELETATDYKKEYDRIYSQVTAGQVSPNQAKVLLQIMNDKKKIQAKEQEAVNNPLASICGAINVYE